MLGRITLYTLLLTVFSTAVTVSAQTAQNPPLAVQSGAAQTPATPTAEALAARRNTLEAQRTELQNERSNLQEQRRALQKQEEALREQEAALAQRLGQQGGADAQQQALTLQKEALGAQKAALEAQFRALGPRADALQTRLETLQAQEAALGAQQQQLSDFFAALLRNPELAAARAALRAAEEQLDALRGPATLETTAGLTSLGLNDGAAAQNVAAQQVGGQPGEVPTGGDVPTRSEQLSANVTFRPFPFGDVADGVRQAELAVRSSLLDYREALTGLEARALGAALDLRLAEQSLEFSQESVALAREALAATRTRFELGAANARELRDAEANFQEAQNFALGAQENLELARLNLTNLVGDTPAPGFELLAALPTPPERTPLAVLRAEVPVEQAAVGVSGARREVYPTAQASYNYNLDDKSSLSASIESRTLQPSVGYSYQNPARTLPDSAVRSSLTLGVSATIPLDGFDAIDAAGEQLGAARAGFQASRDGAAVQRAALQNSRVQAERTLTLEALQFRNAQTNFSENQQRQELGLIAPLETQQALIDLLNADLELRQARQGALQALLELYSFYALPPSEVLG